MATTRKADIVFCLDVSASMQPCIKAVKSQIDGFISTFQNSSQMVWDLRLGLLAHHATVSAQNQGGVVVGTTTLYVDSESYLQTLYTGSSKVFTSDPSTFRATLADLDVSGDEAMLFALDCALDFPWRDSGTCHRVVVMLTDEPIEDGLMREASERLVEEIVRKVMQLKVMLFIVGPDSAMIEQLSMADRSEWELVDGYDGLAEVDFRKLLQSIARSISVSSFGHQNAAAKKALFGQDSWGTVSGVEFVGA